MSNDPRKKPIQSRSRETVRAILEAAARILATEGPDGLTTNRVAKVAGVSIGSLYQYFPDRNAVVAGLLDQRLEEDGLAVAGALATVAEMAPRDRITRVVEVMLERQAEAAPWLATLLPLLSEYDRETRARQMVEGGSAAVAALLLATPEVLRPELRDPARLAVALFAVTRAVRGLVNAAAVERPALLRDPGFREVAARMVEAALLA